MAEEQKKQGVGLLPKILLLVGIVLIASVLIFGIKLDLFDILRGIITLIVGSILIFLVIKGIQALLPKNEFSPTQRWKDRLTRIAELSKPFNVKDLYIRGEDMRVYSLWGKITGLAFIPYHAGKPLKDKLENYIYEKKLSHAGKEIKDDFGENVMQIKKGMINESDGEWCFIIERGLLPFMKTKEIVRADIKLCSDIGDKVWIKTPNLLPIGDYFYPAQQWQNDIVRILNQHQSEAVLETHQEYLDLIAKVTESSLRANPDYRKMQEMNTETINTNGQQIIGAGKT